MIKIGEKLYGEKNHPNTVVANKKFTLNKFVVRRGVLTESLDITKQAILTFDSNNKYKAFEITEPNVYVGTDGTGQLVTFQLDELSPDIPEGREFITEVIGANYPTGVIGNREYLLTDVGHYEVEIFGAGGGGGAGGVHSYLYNIPSEGFYEALNGCKGGNGGYYKHIFSITTPTIIEMYAGNGGGGGRGHHVVRSGTILSDLKGGDGGASYKIDWDTEEDILLDGSNAIWGEAGIIPGTTGIEGGANGGTSNDVISSALGKMGAAGGGARKGFGGNGGNALGYHNDDGIHNPTLGQGAAGGAGGGIGFSGKGGSSKTQIVEGKPRITIAGGIGYGGAGGGAGSVGYVDGELYYNLHSGGGGGGGGASMVYINDETIICGGGGGGAGTALTITGLGQLGGNNKNEIAGNGSVGGSGGQSKHYGEIGVYTHGSNGAPGKVILRKCVLL